MWSGWKMTSGAHKSYEPQTCYSTQCRFVTTTCGCGTTQPPAGGHSASPFITNDGYGCRCADSTQHNGSGANHLYSGGSGDKPEWRFISGTGVSITCAPGSINSRRLHHSAVSNPYQGYPYGTLASAPAQVHKVAAFIQTNSDYLDNSGLMRLNQINY